MIRFSCKLPDPWILSFDPRLRTPVSKETFSSKFFYKFKCKDNGYSKSLTVFSTSVGSFE